MDSQIAHLRREAEIGGYEAANEAQGQLTAVYDSIAKLMGAGGEEIALMESATVAWLAGFHAVTRNFKAGDKSLTCEAGYAANFVSLLQLWRRRGVEIVVVPSDALMKIRVVYRTGRERVVRKRSGTPFAGVKGSRCMRGKSSGRLAAVFGSMLDKTALKTMLLMETNP